MEDDDIDRWVDLLAGKAGMKARPEEAVEIARIRAAIVAQAAEEAESLPPPPPDELGDERAWQRVKAQIHLDATSKPMRTKRFAWPALATAAVLLIAVSVTWLKIGDRDDILIVHEAAPQYRGAVPVIDVKDPSPLTRAKHLAKRLMPLATKPRVYFFDGRATVEIEISDASLAAVIKELAAEGIPTAGLVSGIAQVNFLPP